MSVLLILLERLASDSRVAQDAQNVTLLHVAAARKCQLEVLCLLVKWQPDSVFVVDDHGNTAMHYAVHNTHARSLVDSTVCGPWHENVYGAAVEVNRHFVDSEVAARPVEACVRMLGIQWPNACAVENHAGMVPFDYVVASNCMLAVASLVLSYHVSAIVHRDRNNMTPMHRACTRASPEAILAKGGLGEGTAGFFRSAGKERFRVVSWILERFPLAAEQRCVNGALPLHFAAFNNSDALVVAKLIQSYPAGLSAGDSGGETPFHLAARWVNTPFASNDAVLRLMLHSSPNFDILNNMGHSVLRATMPCLMGGEQQTEALNEDLVKYVARASRDTNEIVVSILAGNPAALWVRDMHGQTPVEYSYGLVMAGIDKPRFAFLFQQHLIFIVCVLGVLRSSFVDHGRAFAEIDHICDMLLVLKKCIVDASERQGIAMQEDIEAAFSQMTSGLASVRVALEISQNRKQQDLIEETMRTERAVAMMVLNYNQEKELAEKHALELLEMVEAERTPQAAGGAGAKRRERNRRMLLERRETETQVAEQQHIMDSIQGRRMRQESDNARIKKLNRKKGRQANTGAAQGPPAAVAAAATIEPERPWCTTRAQDTEQQPPHVFVLPLVAMPAAMPLAELAAAADAVKPLPLAEPDTEPDAAALAEPDAERAPEPDAAALAEFDAEPGAVQLDAEPDATAGAAEPAMCVDAQRAACLVEARASILAQQQRDRECSVCMDAVKTNPFVPCGHVAVCDACAENILQSASKKCLMCRATVTSVMRIFYN